MYSTNEREREKGYYFVVIEREKAYKNIFYKSSDKM